MEFSKYTSRAMDGVFWRCPWNRCRFKTTIRQDTMFKFVRVTIMEQLRVIMHYFVR